ncbi:MAG: riboflavin synthase [Flavobacteriales bacterium]|nr:riboflavin synthase [Flavobacteriales bacterium]
MFTGIIENTAVLINIQENDNNLDLSFTTDLLSELKIDQSISHNGVCLTVVDISNESYVVNVIKETLRKSNLGTLKIGDFVNVERSTQINSRLDGHIVQGHVDQIGICQSIEEQGGSYFMTFKYEPSENITVEKGSVCVNGISLTVVNSMPDSFSVAIIPYTWDNTNLQDVQVGGSVNLEFDILGKYVSKLMSRS